MGHRTGIVPIKERATNSTSNNASVTYVPLVGPPQILRTGRFPGRLVRSQWAFVFILQRYFVRKFFGFYGKKRAFVELQCDVRALAVAVPYAAKLKSAQD